MLGVGVRMSGEWGWGVHSMVGLYDNVGVHSFVGGCGDIVGKHMCHSW